MTSPIERGSRVRFLETDGFWVYGVVEDLGRKTPASPLVAVVAWDDGKTTNIYADRLHAVIGEKEDE